MRKSCIECVLKHLGSAAIYIEETELGYPNYFGYAYGELDHAASECINEIPDLAWAIREHRIKWSQTRKNPVRHRIPFEAIFEYLDTVEEIGGVLEVTPGVYEGLALGDNGKPLYSMDTRPQGGGDGDANSVGEDARTPPPISLGNAWDAVPVPLAEISLTKKGE